MFLYTLKTVGNVIVTFGLLGAVGMFVRAMSEESGRENHR